MKFMFLGAGVFRLLSLLLWRRQLSYQAKRLEANGAGGSSSRGWDCRKSKSRIDSLLGKRKLFFLGAFSCCQFLFCSQNRVWLVLQNLHHFLITALQTLTFHEKNLSHCTVEIQPSPEMSASTDEIISFSRFSAPIFKQRYTH